VQFVARVSAYLGVGPLQIGFFDEFGHIGPFVSRNDPKYRESPIFGLAGYLMPSSEVRKFATFFLQLKQHMFAAELAGNADNPATWEKKGSEFLNRRNMSRYPHLREGMRRLLNRLERANARILFYGRQKYQKPEDSSSSGLYSTVLAHLIRRSDKYCKMANHEFMMILDQHSDRLKLLQTAAKTMFSPEAPARCLIEPPFQVESHLYQTIQAADWIATLVGRIAAHSVLPNQYSDWKWAEDYFGQTIRRLATESTLWRPRTIQKNLPNLA
jgi:hypothetical protein